MNDFIEKQKEKGINFTNESLLLKWLRESANALRYLHEEHQKIHRDIKPLNIFLTKEDHVKLGDFGLTLTTNDKKSIILSKDAGTLYYYSPETIDDIKYSFKTDIWYQWHFKCYIL